MRRARKVSGSELYGQVFVAPAFAHGLWFSRLLKQGALFRRLRVQSHRHTTYRHSSSDTRGENLKRGVVSFSALCRTAVDSSGIYTTRFSSPCDFRYAHALEVSYSVRQQHTRKTVTSSLRPLPNAQLAPPSSPTSFLMLFSPTVHLGRRPPIRAPISRATPPACLHSCLYNSPAHRSQDRNCHLRPLREPALHHTAHLVCPSHAF